MANVATGGQLYKPETKRPTAAQTKPKRLNPDLQRVYTHRHTGKNLDYEAGLVRLTDVRPSPEGSTPLRSCLIHNNAEISRGDILIKTQPKWLTVLDCLGIDTHTGEIGQIDPYRTNDLKAGNARKIAALDKFCNHFHPLYVKREVSVIMHTLTQADFAATDIRSLIDVAKYRYSALKREIRGYFWTLEVSTPEQDKVGYHPHYHLVIACDRLNFRGKGMSDYLKFDDVWGQRTQAQFVRKNIRHYLSGYFAKNDWRVTDVNGSRVRMYGTSRKFE